MESCVKTFLMARQYTINDKALSLIKECDDWYSNKVLPFHKRKTVQGTDYELNRTNFVKRSCSDDANLCEVVEISAGNKAQCDYITDWLNANNFNVIYRKQLEKVSANGTVACYIRVDNANIMSDGTAQGGTIRLNYIDAQCFIPLTIDQDQITEAAFSGSGIRKGKKITTLVLFTLDEMGRYISETHIFNEYGVENKDEAITLQLDTIKPFAVMRNAEANNLEDMEGYGLPKVHNAIPIFECLDLAFNVLFGDLDKGEKLLLINEILCKFDTTGKPITPCEQAKKTFVMLQKDLDSKTSLVTDYNPEIRADDVTKTFELLLSLLSLSFGYGTKKYSFENGQITTATEYIGERQDQMQELNRQRQEAKQYITDIVKACMWFSNTYSGSTWDLGQEVTIDFDDSFITDKEAELDRKRNDSLSFDIPQLTIWYLMDAYTLTEEEATALVEAKEEAAQDNPPKY